VTIAYPGYRRGPAAPISGPVMPISGPAAPISGFAALAVISAKSGWTIPASRRRRASFRAAKAVRDRLAGQPAGDLPRATCRQP